MKNSSAAGALSQPTRAEFSALMEQSAQCRSLGSSKTTWTPAEVRRYYDRHLNMTLAGLSIIARRSVADLKAILLEEDNP